MDWILEPFLNRLERLSARFFPAAVEPANQNDVVQENLLPQTHDKNLVSVEALVKSATQITKGRLKGNYWVEIKIERDTLGLSKPNHVNYLMTTTPLKAGEFIIFTTNDYSAVRDAETAPKRTFISDDIVIDRSVLNAPNPKEAFS